MKKYLLIVLLVGVWSCEDEVSVPSTVNLPSFNQVYDMFYTLDSLDAVAEDVILTNDNNYLMTIQTNYFTGGR